MSFGSLSANAIRALNGGAKLGGFYHDTGEGGYSPYHREGGGDIVWEIGSGYFGARNDDGTFSPERFAEGAKNPQVKMVELKLSQGAKPGHGGVLPAPKVSHEISLTRGVPMGQDCVSPSRHSAFSTPVEMMRFIAEMRRLSGGKPAGFKLCIGHEWEFLAICKAMLETGSIPTSSSSTARRAARARPPWSSSTISASRCGRASTSCTTPWSASACATASSSAPPARSSPPSTSCAPWRWAPTGATPRAASCSPWAASSRSTATPTAARPASPPRTRRASARWWCPTRSQRVVNFHRATVHELAELTAAAGLEHPNQFKPIHISRRVSPSEVVTFDDVYPALDPGALLSGTAPPRWTQPWNMADAHSFRAVA